MAAFQGTLRYHEDYPDVHYHLARTFDDPFIRILGVDRRVFGSALSHVVKIVFLNTCQFRHVDVLEQEPDVFVVEEEIGHGDLRWLSAGLFVVFVSGIPFPGVAFGMTNS